MCLPGKVSLWGSSASCQGASSGGLISARGYGAHGLTPKSAVRVRRVTSVLIHKPQGQDCHPHLSAPVGDPAILPSPPAGPLSHLLGSHVRNSQMLHSRSWCPPWICAVTSRRLIPPFSCLWPPPSPVTLSASLSPVPARETGSHACCSCWVAISRVS